MKRVAILQSNYIPWKGYFDIIAAVDEFILYDDMQYTKRDWRNRNKIKTPQGAVWMTIPVDVSGKYFQKINETRISDSCWGQKHWKTLEFNYGRTKYFKQYKECFGELYMNLQDEHLSMVNYKFIKAICELLGIETKISWSSDYGIIDGKTERLVDLCVKAGANEYISGPSAKDYIENRFFDEANIKLQYFEYPAYPEYEQLFPPFDHYVSVLDLLFNTGSDAVKYMQKGIKS